MGNLAEDSLGGEALREMFAELYAVSANPTGVQIQAALAKRGVRVSLPSALNTKKKNFPEFLAEIKRSREQAELIVSAGTTGEERAGAAAVMLIEQITDQILQARLEGRELDADTLEKTVLNVTRLAKAFQDAKKLKADLALRDEQIARLQADAREREERAAAAKAALENVKSKGGLTAETLQRIEEAAGLL